MPAIVIGLRQRGLPNTAAIGEEIMQLLRAALCAAFALASCAAFAADYPAPKQGEWIAKDFKFHTGHTMPELRLHYTTVGEPTGQPVLMLHGTGHSRTSTTWAHARPATDST